MMENVAERIVDTVVASLAEDRKRQGMTLQELAERTGTDRSYIGLLESRKRRPSLYVAIRLANALGHDLSSVLLVAERRSKTKLDAPRKRLLKHSATKS